MCGNRVQGLHIRGFKPLDIQVLYQMDSVCFPADIAYSRAELQFYISHKDSITRVAELKDVVVGFAVGRVRDRSTAHVMTLDVIQSARRSRVGTALIDSLHHEFRSKGARLSFLEVDVENVAARRFYEAHKYRYVEVLPGYYNGRSDALRMVRNLALD